MEVLFTPVAIYNNTKDDADARTRKRFEEPAWNNPVVRIVDVEGEDLVKRHADDYTLAGLLEAMKAAHVNAWVGEKEDPTPLLSPSQLTLLDRIRTSKEADWPNAIGVDLREAWRATRARMAATE